jgi:cytochrome b6-f complex iron-sulfur subunit
MKRRDFIKTGAAVGIACTCAATLGSCSAITGTSSTPEAPIDSYTFNNNAIMLDLDKASHLAKVGGSVKMKVSRPNKEELKVIVIRRSEDEYHAFTDKCTHGGRELEYIHNESKLSCVSFGSSKFNLQGKVLSGPAKDDLGIFELNRIDNVLEILV